MQQGTCVLTLKDPDGKYNPENASGVLYGKLLPMRPLKITCVQIYGFTVNYFSLFHGFISRIEFNPETRETIIEGVDLFEWLTTYSPSIGTVLNYTVGQIIGLILDSLGWTDPTMRSIEAGGNVVPSWSADGGTTSIGLIETLLQTDLGTFYISNSGVATYKTRCLLYCNGAALYTISDSVNVGFNVSIEKDSIINGQYACKTGGSKTFATNTESRKSFGYRNGSPVTTDQFESDTAASSFANFIVAINGNPRSPTRNITLINKDDATLYKQLIIELTDMVEVSEAIGNTSFNGRVQSISQTISGGYIKTVLSVQKTSINAFTIGYSTIGGADVIAY
jgi:hypothetical protein